jgi:hypothetical protein
VAWNVTTERTERDVEIELHRARPHYQSKRGRRLRKRSSDLFWLRDGLLVDAGSRGYHLEAWDPSRTAWIGLEYVSGVGCGSSTYPVSVTSEGFFAGPQQWFVDQEGCERQPEAVDENPCRQ